MTPQKTCRREKVKVISREHPATSRRQFQCIEWDALNRLIKVELKGTPNITVAEISYDVLNRRVWREADEDRDGTPDEDLTYVWDGWRNVEERDFSTEGLLRDYVYGGAYIDEVVHGRSDFWDGSTPGPDGDFADSKEQFYYTTNNLYSVAALVDTSGAVIERYEYLPYGTVTVYTGAGVDSTWFTSDDATSSYSDIQHVTFTGRRSDPESELMYFRNRYYSAELGRFVGRDPVGYEDSLNLYEYVSAQPTGSCDPLGLWWIWRWKKGACCHLSLEKHQLGTIGHAKPLKAPGKIHYGEGMTVTAVLKGEGSAEENEKCCRLYVWIGELKEKEFIGSLASGKNITGEKMTINGIAADNKGIRVPLGPLQARSRYPGGPTFGQAGHYSSATDDLMPTKLKEAGSYTVGAAWHDRFAMSILEYEKPEKGKSIPAAPSAAFSLKALGRIQSLKSAHVGLPVTTVLVDICQSGPNAEGPVVLGTLTGKFTITADLSTKEARAAFYRARACAITY